jgi:hypothetical protein
MAGPPAKVVKSLAAYFRRNGYVRRLNPLRRKREGQGYKKGDEVRLVAESYDELRAIRGLLRQAGFKVARPFRKARQWRQPVYGIDEVARFLKLVRRRRRKRTSRASRR